MKNKNGFTLIELLITIAIIGIIGVIATISLMGMLDKQDEEKIDNYKKDLAEAACVFVELSTSGYKEKTCYKTTIGCSITTKELIEAGLVASDTTNPITGADVSNTEIIKVTWNISTGKKTCTYSG